MWGCIMKDQAPDTRAQVSKDLKELADYIWDKMTYDEKQKAIREYKKEHKK